MAWLGRADRSGHARRRTDFAGTWEKKYPAVVNLWENARGRVRSFLGFDPEVRAVTTPRAQSNLSTPGSGKKSNLVAFPNRDCRAEVCLSSRRESPPDRARAATMGESLDTFPEWIYNHLPEPYNTNQQVTEFTKRQYQLHSKCTDPFFPGEVARCGRRTLSASPAILRHRP